MLPLYLQNKLKFLQIYNKYDLLKYNYLQVFKWLKAEYPSLNNNVLLHLYSIYNDLPLHAIAENTKVNILNNYKSLLPSYKPLNHEFILYFMNYIHNLALSTKNVPVATAIVYKEEIIASSVNDIYEHSEIIAINKAISILGTNRLNDCDIYVNIEPCLKCAGAIINSKFKRLIFGAKEEKTGAVISQYKVFNNKNVNHFTEVIGPIDNEKFSFPIKNFFKGKR